jgi:hypothetical protein
MMGHQCRFTSEFGIGERVFLRMADERRAALVLSINFCADGGAIYTVGWGNASDTRHYAIELTREFEPNFEVDND